MGAAGLLLAYVGGLGCAPFLPPFAGLPALPFVLAGAWLVLRFHPGGAVCLLACLWSLGLTQYHRQITPPDLPTHLRAFVSEEPRVIEGIALAVSPRHPAGATIDLQAQRIVIDGLTAPVEGRVRLYVAEEMPPATPGDRLRFRSRLRPPRLFGTPGEFDYPRYLAARGIFVTAFVPKGREIAVFPTAAASLKAWRGRIGRGIAAAVDPSLAPLVSALVIGDKGGIAPEQRDLLARGGVSHLFAISGLHLGLIALFLYALARFFYSRSERLLLFCPPRRCLPVLLLPLLYAYLQLTGSALPTRRAFLMAAAGALFLLWSRRSPSLRLLAAAALLILLVAPLALFEPSFQLSFAGVLGILLLVPPWTRRLARLPPFCRWPATMLLTTLAASIATTPFALLHFHLLAPAGLLLNLVAVPLIGFVAVPLGLIGAVVSPWWSPLSAPLFRGCALVLQGLLDGCAWAVSFPLLSGWQVYLSPARLAAAFALAAGLLLLGRGDSRRPASALLAAGTLLFLLPAPAPAGLTVTALSVGQGEAILLSRAGGRHYLIDGGGLPGGTFDVGERLVAPALGRLGVRALEAVILTHDHPDHRQGLLAVLASFPVGGFWTAAAPEELDPDLHRLLRQKNIPIRQFSLGWTAVDQSAEESLTVFVPPQNRHALNDSSLVLRASCAGEAVLLTGDLEQIGVEELLAAPPPAATLLKLPHHGSRRSQPRLLLEALRPQAAFVCLGAGNPYGFPHAEAVAAVAALGIPLHRTDLQGTVRFRTAGTEWQTDSWRRGVFR